MTQSAIGFSLLASAVLLMPVPASAQAVDPLTSNRPGIGDSEALVGRGAIQVETGMLAAGAPAGIDRRWTQTFGQFTLRVGPATRLELFAAWDGLSVERDGRGPQAVLVAGGGDLRVGAKLAVLDEARHGLTLAVAPAWSFPVGGDAFSSGSNDGSLRLLVARSLPREWSAGANLLFTSTTDEAERYWETGVMGGLSRAVTPALGAFIEVSGALASGRPDEWTMDGGLAWVVGPDLQWDISAGHTFNGRGDRWFLSAGVSIRVRRPAR